MNVPLPIGAYVVREHELSDRAALVKYADNAWVAAYLRDVFPRPYTMADAEAWITHCAAQNPVTHFAIASATELIGGIGVTMRSDVYRRSAELGYWLAEPYWGRGIATDAVRAVTDWAFAELDLVRLFAAVFSPNVASARVLEKAGFTLEGRHVKAVVKDGKLYDELIYAVVRV